MSQSPHVTQMEYLVLTKMFLTQTSNAKTPISRVLTRQFEDSQPSSDKIGSKNEDPPKINRLILMENQASEALGYQE